MLKASHLRYSYHAGSPVLEDVDLALEEGKITCLLGPSGCGKTTLLSLLAGLVPPQQGEITSDIERPGPALGYVTQDSDLLPWLTAEKNAALASSLHPAIAPPDKVHMGALFDHLNLSGCKHAYPHEMSGGQRQRLALIRTLIANPRLLLLDEPLGHLDAVLRLKAAQVLRRYVAENKATALIVTHQLDEAVHLADRIVTLSDKPTRVLDVYSLDTPVSRRDAFMALSETLANAVVRPEGEGA